MEKLRASVPSIIERFLGLTEELRKDVEKGGFGWNGELTIVGGLVCSIGSMDATLLDREANRSLTTDTMCQNLFDPIRVFEHEWVE